MKEIHITDHAVVRYLERVLGLDVEEFKKKIVHGELGATILKLETGKFPLQGVNGPVKAVVEDCKIITFR